MGGPLSGTLANIYLGYLEKKVYVYFQILYSTIDTWTTYC